MTILRMRYGHFLCTPFLFLFFIRLFSGIGYLVGTSDAIASVLISKGVLLSDCVKTRSWRLPEFLVRATPKYG